MMSSILSVLADIDGGSLIWIVIILGGFIFSAVREWLKKANASDEDASSEESAHERKVRQIIEDIKRGHRATGAPATTMAPASSYEPPSVSPIPPMPRRQESEITYQTGQLGQSGQRPVDLSVHSEADAEAILRKMKNPTTTAGQEMASLSDEELVALNKLRVGKSVSQASPIAVTPTSYSLPIAISKGCLVNQSSLRNSLRNADMIKSAILYHEILGEPVALRRRVGGVGL
ncbi:MAG: hypothetical protein RSE01_05370 [Akkermansia sp.]